MKDSTVIQTYVSDRYANVRYEAQFVDVNSSVRRDPGHPIVVVSGDGELEDRESLAVYAYLTREQAQTLAHDLLVTVNRYDH